MDFKMKNSLKIALFAVLFVFPLLASANNKDVFEGEYLNLGDSVEQNVLNIESNTPAKPSDLNQWGSNWGNKIPFKANTPYDVAVYDVEISTYFPKF